MAKIDDIREQIAGRVAQRDGGSPLPSIVALGLGTLAGGALVYLFDPEKGTSRRAQARDRLNALVRQGTQEAERVGRRASAQAQGLTQRVAHLRPEPKDPMNDAALTEKVKEELFSDPSIPSGQLNINAERGVIVIRGQVESPELIEEIERRVRKVQGVWEVQNLVHLPGLPVGSGA